MLPHKFVE